MVLAGRAPPARGARRRARRSAIADSAFNAGRAAPRSATGATAVVPILLDPGDLDADARPATLASRLAAETARRRRPTGCSSGGCARTRRSTTSSRRSPRTASPTTRGPGCIWSAGRRRTSTRRACRRSRTRSASATPSTLAGSVTAGELAAHYRAADVFVCLSRHEGFCVPLLEAMHHGVPDRRPARRRGARDAGRRRGPACRRRTPALVAAAVERVRTDPGLRRRAAGRGPRAGSRLRPRPAGRAALRRPRSATCAVHRDRVPPVRARCSSRARSGSTRSRCSARCAAAGIESEIFTEFLHPSMAGRGRACTASTARPRGRPPRRHAPVPVRDRLGRGRRSCAAGPSARALDHHNLTPARDARGVGAAGRARASRGAGASSSSSRRRVDFGLAVSTFNRAELRDAGYRARRRRADPARPRRVRPRGRRRRPSPGSRPTRPPAAPTCCSSAGSRPNKCQHDLIKALAAYRRSVRPAGPAAPRRRVGVRPLRRRAARVRDARPGSATPSTSPGRSPTGALGAYYRCRRRVRVGLRARGLLRAAARGDAPRRAGRRVRRRGRARDARRRRRARRLEGARRRSPPRSRSSRTTTRHRRSAGGGRAPPARRLRARRARAAGCSTCWRATAWAWRREARVRRAAVRRRGASAAPSSRSGCWPSGSRPARHSRSRCSRPARSTRAPGPTSTRRARRPLRGVRVHRFTATGRRPDFDTVVGAVRSAVPSAVAREEQELLQLQGPVAPALVDAVRRATPTSWCSRRTCSTRSCAAMPGGRRAGGAAPGGARRGGAAPAPVPGGVRHASGRSSSTPTPSSAWCGAGSRSRPTPQVVLGLGCDARPGDEAAARARLGVGDRPYLLCLGRVEGGKGTDALARAFARYKAPPPGAARARVRRPGGQRPPAHPDMIVAGTVDEPTKWGAAAGRARAWCRRRRTSRSRSSCSRRGRRARPSS